MTADLINLHEASAERQGDPDATSPATAQDVAHDGLARLLARLQQLAAHNSTAEAAGLEEVLQCTAALLAGHHGYTAQDLNHLLVLPLRRSGR